MKTPLFLKDIFSNRLFLVVLIVIPFVLTVAFSNVIFNEEHLGARFGANEELEEYKRGQGFRDKRMVPYFYENVLNVSEINPILDDLQEKRFVSTVFSTFNSLSKVCILLGSLAFIVSGGRMLSNGSIVYHIVNKDSRREVFTELFGYPLSFLMLPVLLGTLSVSSLMLRYFIELNASETFLMTLSFVFLSSVQGYVLGSFFSVLLRNEAVSIMGVLGFIFGLSMFPKGELMVVPHKALLQKVFYGGSINHTWFNVIGFVLIIGLFTLSYILFKRGDFY